MANLDRATRTANANTDLPDNVTQDISPADVRQGRIDNIDSALSLLDDIEQGTLTCSLVDIGATATYTINGTNEFRYTRVLDFVKFKITLTNLDADVQGTGELRVVVNAMPASIQFDPGSPFPVSFGSLNSSGFASIIAFSITTNNLIFLTTTSTTSNNNTNGLSIVDFGGIPNAISIEGTYFIN